MTTCDTPPGWGVGWGLAPWGGDPNAGFKINTIEAVRDNVIRISFSQTPRYTGVLDPRDASNPKRYQVVNDPTTYGYDGLPCRPVRVILASVVNLPSSVGRVIDITLDRPMSPYPSEYTVSTNNLFDTAGIPLDPCFASLKIKGLYRFLQPQDPSLMVPSRDIANPSTLSGLIGSVQVSEKQLGIIPIGPDGDYAFDEGITNLKKRVWRRLITTPGSFTFMPSYGVGVTTYLKKLNLASTRQQIATLAQNQISQEPDVERCIVSFTTDPKYPNLVYVNVLVKAKIQSQSIKFIFPFQLPSG